MIPVPSGVRVWLAVGRTDMRKGMNGLVLQAQPGGNAAAVEEPAPAKAGVITVVAIACRLRRSDSIVRHRMRATTSSLARSAPPASLSGAAAPPTREPGTA